MDVSHLSIENEGSSNRKIINNTYRILKKIGQGQFGKVMLAENVSEKDSNILLPTPSTNSIKGSRKKSSEKSPKNKYVAIKTINRIDKTRLITKTYLSHTTKIKREIQIMKGCKHPNVVQLYQVIDDLKYDKILLVLEYCKYGEVDWKNYNHYHEKHNKNGQGLTLNKLLRDVINGLEYLHDYKHIIHRDLKPSNLLISADKTIKISDFGVSLILENNANDDKELGKTMGTPAFFAPELCQFVNNRLSMLNDADRAKSKIDNKIDLWSLGVILYCLVFHNLPFNGNNEFSLFKKIVTEPLKFPQIKKSSRTTLEDVNELKLLKDLINKLLIKDPKQRMTIKDIKQHAFTTFDLQNSKQISEFVEFNKKLISNQNKPISNETGLATKIRKFFSNKTEPSLAPPNHDIIQQQKEHEINEQKLLNDPTSLSNLEPVDDLLNSYFDDSSSMGSLEKEEVEPYDTSEVLRSLNDDNLKEQDSQSAFNMLISNSSNLSISSHKALEKPPSATTRTLREKPSNDNFSIDKFFLNSPTNNAAFNSEDTLKNPSFESKNKVGVPPPLKIKDSFHEKNNNSNPSLNTITTAQKTPLSTQTFNHSPIMTPGTTNDEIITIGAGSPSSIKSMISPSRRFFSRSKKSTKLQSAESEKKPTISSLSSPEKKPKERLQNTKKFTDLMEPPPIFGGLTSKTDSNNKSSEQSYKNNKSFEIPNQDSISLKVFNESPKNVASPTCSRKNSVSSSIRSVGLTRIASSTSSLNLNAYLTDDAFSLSSTTKSKHKRLSLLSSSSISEQEEIELPSLPPPKSKPLKSPTNYIVDNSPLQSQKSPYSFKNTVGKSPLQLQHDYSSLRNQTTPTAFSRGIVNDQLDFSRNSDEVEDENFSDEEQADDTFVVGGDDNFNFWTNGVRNASLDIPYSTSSNANSREHFKPQQLPTELPKKRIATMDEFLDRIE